jgi:hypothetical protein
MRPKSPGNKVHIGVVVDADVKARIDLIPLGFSVSAAINAFLHCLVDDMDGPGAKWLGAVESMRRMLPGCVGAARMSRGLKVAENEK